MTADQRLRYNLAARLEAAAIERAAAEQRLVLAIDPGTFQSAWLIMDNPIVVAFGIWKNEQLLEYLRNGPMPSTVVIEKIESFGMRVGAELFETVYWSGQFAEAAHPTPVERIGRVAIKVHLCGSARAKDPNVRQALIDRFGGDSVAKGTKAKPGPLYGISTDVWSALAVACTFADRGLL